MQLVLTRACERLQIQQGTLRDESAVLVAWYFYGCGLRVQ